MFEEHIGRLKLLHAARQRVAENAARWRELQDAFDREHAEFLENRILAVDIRQQVEMDIRDNALVLYKTIPNLEKTSIPGVTIRETKIMGFSPEKALDWALEHHLALRLDEKVYKEMVLSGQAPGTVLIEPRVAIASDLSPFVVNNKEVK